MSLNDFIRPNVYDCYWTLCIFSVLFLSTDHYLQDSKKNERTARSHFRKGPGYDVLVAYTTWSGIEYEVKRDQINQIISKVNDIFINAGLKFVQ